MLDHITPLNDLLTEAKKINDFLEITCSETVEAVVERGNDLAVYISRTGKMLADAKYHKDQKLKTSIIETLRQTAKIASIPATTINKLIDANCETENYCMNWIERLNRTATHQLDWLRTLVSKAKEEMRTSSGISGKQNGSF